jgi:hypothetical protein
LKFIGFCILQTTVDVNGRDIVETKGKKYARLVMNAKENLINFRVEKLQLLLKTKNIVTGRAATRKGSGI